MSKPLLITPMSNRTNYSKIRPVLLQLRESDALDLQIALSSSILLNQYGNAHEDVLNDGFDIRYKIDCLLSNDSLESMSKTFGLSLIEHSTMYAFAKPQAILVTGDRFDILGAVLSARMMNIPILHIQGGEVTGSIDDTVRDLITLCASRHYTATDGASLRVSMLASIADIFNFGCPAVEMVSQMDGECPWSEVGLSPNDQYFLIALHPNTESQGDINMKTVIDVCLQFNRKLLVFHPNPDAFNRRILCDILERKECCRLIKHLPIASFVKVMANCDCMIGNSSAGIREAASFGTPVINIGNRQRCRERNKNTIDIPCNTTALSEAIEKSLKVGRYPKENIYLKPNAAKNIAADIVQFLKRESP